MLERLHVSVHIEKTAGTSLLDFYQRFYGKDNILVYIPRVDKCTKDPYYLLLRTNGFLNYLKKILGNNSLFPFVFQLYHANLLKRNDLIDPSTVPGHIKVVHGHFPPDKFDNVVKNPFRSVVFRDPFDRMWSHFQHWRRLRGHEYFRTRISYDPHLTFGKFSLLPDLVNFQTKALAGRKLGSFDLVGTTERLEIFAEQLIQIVGGSFTGAGITKVNIARRDDYEKSIYKDDPDFMELFRTKHYLDYENYDLAASMAEGYVT